MAVTADGYFRAPSERNNLRRPEALEGRRQGFRAPRAPRERQAPFRFLIFPPHEKARNISQQAVIASPGRQRRDVAISFCTA